MRITSIPQIYRHVNRWTEIVRVLIKYELAAWIGRLGPDFVKDFLKAPGDKAIARLRWETRLRLAFAELGPTFIKLGQLLSTRPDLVGNVLAEELQHLQSDAPADPPAAVRKILQGELGQPVEEVFAEFDDQALASASIGQVHRARLPEGQSVVVKILHADIEKKLNVDLEILAGLAQLAEMSAEFQNYRPRAIVAEFQRSIRHELDFSRELRNLQQFICDFRNNPLVHFPRPYPEYSSRRMLTMELIEGVKLADLQQTPPPGCDREEIARRGAAVCLAMIFDHGFYHADPHPGNILVLRDCVIGLLDFGMVGRIDDRLHEDLSEMLMALSDQDAEQLTAMILRMGKAPTDLDRPSLTLDVADFLAHYTNQPLDQFDLSGALREITETIRRYQIMLPARIAMLIKALITLEGTARFANPKFNLVEMMRPYRSKLLWQRFSPVRRLRKMRRVFAEVERMIEHIPRGVTDIFEQVQSGKFDVHLDHRGLEPSVNRLVLGLITSALFVGSALLLSRDVPPLIYLPWIKIPQISAPGLAGTVVSVLLGLRLWRAISKAISQSSHTNRSKND
ncbi:MAG: AarF/ABC1/UbiB kinase family protein [Pirellulales bacterium]|nr:AarF/ABC1/UbiB kinase family protein [Pirellulales bacterium]